MSNISSSYRLEPDAWITFPSSHEVPVDEIDYNGIKELGNFLEPLQKRFPHILFQLNHVKPDSPAQQYHVPIKFFSSRRLSGIDHFKEMTDEFDKITVTLNQPEQRATKAVSREGLDPDDVSETRSRLKSCSALSKSLTHPKTISLSTGNGESSDFTMDPRPQHEYTAAEETLQLYRKEAMLEFPVTVHGLLSETYIVTTCGKILSIPDLNMLREIQRHKSVIVKGQNAKERLQILRVKEFEPDPQVNFL